MYQIANKIWFLFSLLPFRVLYFFSDILYFPLYYCIRYRRKIVRKNLLNSFPEKDLKTIIRIEKKFYSFFCDYIVETIKLFSISEKNIRKRMTFEGVEEMIKEMGNDKSCILNLGHYCNWEWLTSSPLQLTAENPFVCGQIYHPLENKLFDKLFLKIRGRFHAESIPRKNTLRRIVALKQEKKQSIIAFLSDQTPHGNSNSRWIDFLNQDTCVFLGAERIACQTKSVVFYADMKRIKRGYYHCKFVLLSSAPHELPEYSLTDMYFQHLEKTIQQDPPYWLWSHNRWKRPRAKINP
ncbi:MAG: lysophospholipid acyltransferase family protein [Prevotellaceae bacterium]|jgi:KDO2-lipid IV(A) lauroyltransferase|nr:lysophospholipid acyltransferase family protein [Prevotellaceae bacterium]